MVDLPIFALIVLVSGCLAAGVCAGVVHTWSLRASLYDLQSRLEVVEGNLLREVKARAGQERWKKPDRDLALVQELTQAQAQPAGKYNFWEDPRLKRGAASGVSQKA
jgi:hypothetical protein